jgi:dUTP pyrophosphatase
MISAVITKIHGPGRSRSLYKDMALLQQISALALDNVAEVIEVLISSGQIPEYSHPGDAGADLHAAEAAVLEPGQRATVGTGVSIALPDGYVGFVVPRSGLAAKHGITIVNSPGTVDAGYRGEIRITLLNTDSAEPYSIAVGDRIAQLIVQPVTRARFVQVQTLPGSERGESGFGSTGYATPASSASDKAVEGVRISEDNVIGENA